MEPINLALLASLTANVWLVLMYQTLRVATDRYIKDRDFWRDRAGYWRTLFDDLRRNSILRNPRTGRYMKDFTK